MAQGVGWPTVQALEPCTGLCAAGTEPAWDALFAFEIKKKKRKNAYIQTQARSPRPRLQSPFCWLRQDHHPLASLPLLGYSLTIPSEAEDIHKDHVFKLHFKSHVYYFRAESEYTFER